MVRERLVVGLFVAAVAFSVPVGSLVLAQSEGLTSEDSVGIQVTPVIDEFDVEKGQTFSRVIEIAGLTKQTVTYYPVVLNFEADPDTGTPVFYSNEEKFSKYSLSEWVSFREESFILSPGEKKTLQYIVNVPEDASPGGHYGAVLLSTEEPKLDEQGNIVVGVVGLIGTLVLTTVPGQITEQLVVQEFISPTLLFQAPADFEVRIKNIGNVHVRPLGGITIRNWFGKQVNFMDVNPSKNAILPNSQRHYQTSWDFSWFNLGKYSANLSLSYGTNKSLNELRTFYVVPYWLLVAIAGIIILWLSRRFWKKRRPPKPPAQPRRRRIVMG